MVSNVADNMITATKLVNNIMSAIMNAFKSSMQQAKYNAEELSRIMSMLQKYSNRYQKI